MARTNNEAGCCQQPARGVDVSSACVTPILEHAHVLVNPPYAKSVLKAARKLGLVQALAVWYIVPTEDASAFPVIRPTIAELGSAPGPSEIRRHGLALCPATEYSQCFVPASRQPRQRAVLMEAGFLLSVIRRENE